MAQTVKPLRVAVLASGSGSNLAALLDAINRGDLTAEIAVVISNRADAGALGIAQQQDIPALWISQEQCPSPEKLDRAFLSALAEHDVHLIALAGYLKKITPAIVRKYKNRILNIHPALLPAFGGKGMFGKHVHRAVLEYGCRVTGVTVHLIDEEYDTGPPVMQRCVPVEQHDTPETLAARVLEEEHRIYAEAIQLFAEDRIEVHGRKVVIKGS